MILFLLACKLPEMPPLPEATYDLTCDGVNCVSPDQAGATDNTPWCSWSCVASWDPDVTVPVSLTIWFHESDDGCMEVDSWSESDPSCEW